MKALFYYLGLLTLILLPSCEESEFDVQNPNVDQFARMLKNGSYANKVGYILPDFSTHHIGKLLDYAKDTSAINMFPGNPISSKHSDPKILSECMLWTVDGVRMGTKYPSLEAVLVDETRFTEEEGYERMSGKELLQIRAMYVDWYNEYRQSPSEALLKKDLFEGTNYRWN